MFHFSEENECILISPSAIQFVLSDEFSHMRPEERQQLLPVRACVSRLHLEIDPRGGEMSIYEKRGGKALCTCA